MWNLNDVDLQKKYIEDQIAAIVKKIEDTLGFTELDTLLHNVDKVYEISQNSATLMELVDIKTELTNLSNHINDIIAVEPVADNIGKMVDIANNLSILLDIFNNLSHIVTDSQNIGSIKTVSQSIDSVNTVATDKANIDAVALNKSNIDNVAGNKANIDTVANNIASIVNVALDLLKVANVSDNIDSVNNVSANMQKVDVVSANIGKVVQVANDKANIDAVSSDLLNIDNVASNKTNIDNVASIKDDVVTVSQNKDDVVTVSQNIDNVNAVAGDKANIDAVVQNKQNIDSVATNIVNVNKVAQNEANINAVAANEPDIDTVSQNVSDVNTVAQSIQDVQNVSSNINDVYNYADTYLGSKNSEPNTRNDGSQLIVGDLYFNTQTGLMNVWDGSQWKAAYASVNAYNKDESDARYERLANKLTSFQTTPDDTHYPTEKLVKDSLDLKADKGDTYTKSEVDSSLALKEDKANKVTSFGTTPSDDKYPSEKLVKDSLDTKANAANVYSRSTIDDKLSLKADQTSLDSHTSDTNNPHQVTKEQVGLGNVDNTSDLDKPISTAAQTALNNKANKNLDNVDASDVLNKVKAVDGSGSGLDAELLVGKSLEQLEGRVMSKAEFEALAEVRRKQYAGSGFMEWGGIRPGYVGINKGMWVYNAPTQYWAEAGKLFIGNNSYTPVVNINGYRTRLLGLHTYGALDAADNLIKTPQPPTSLAAITDSTNLPVDMKQGDFAILNDLDRNLTSFLTYRGSDRISSYTYVNGSNTITIEDDSNTSSGYVTLNLKLIKGCRYAISVTVDKAFTQESGFNNFVYNGQTVFSKTGTTGSTDEQVFEFIASESTYIALYANDVTVTYTVNYLKQLEPAPIVALQDISAGTDIYQNTDKFEARDSVSRQDLVFLESWHEDISEKDVVYPYGNIQYRGNDVDGLSGITDTTWFSGYDTYSLFGNWQEPGALVGKGYRWSQLSEADKIKLASNPDNNIYKDGDKWIQVRYRIRVAKGLGNEWKNPGTRNDLQLTYKGYWWVITKGKQVSIDYDFDSANGNNNGHRFLRYLHGGGSTVNGCQIGTWGIEDINQAGYGFALPIALIQRRNQGAYHPVYNPEGSALFAYDDGSTGPDAVEWWQLPDGYVASMSDCFNPDKIACIRPSDNSVETLATYNNDTSDDKNGFKITGLIESGKSGRPDGLYADEINERDVEDLRISAHKKPFREILDEWNRKAIIGKVRGKDGEWLYGGHSVLKKSIEWSGTGTRLYLGKIDKKTQEKLISIFSYQGNYLSSGEHLYLTDRNGNKHIVNYQTLLDIDYNDVYLDFYHNTDIYNNIEVGDKVCFLIWKKADGSEVIVPIGTFEKSYTYNNTLTHTEIIGDPRKLKDRVEYTVTSTDEIISLHKNEYILCQDATNNGGVAGHYYRWKGGSINSIHTNSNDTSLSVNTEGGKIDFSDTTLWIDLGTDGNRGGYPDEWFEKGIEGTPLVVGEEGESLLPPDLTWNNSNAIQVKLSRKNINADRFKKLLVSKKDGAFVECTYGSADYPLKGNINITHNTLTFNIVQSYSDLGYSSKEEMLDLMVVLVTYETKANFLELADVGARVLVLDEVNHLRGARDFEWGAAICNSILNKVGINGEGGRGVTRFGYVYQYYLRHAFNNEIGGYHLQTPIHKELTYNVNATIPMAKTLPFLTVRNNRAYLQYVFKELKYDTDNGTWGDDNKFQITNKVSTITDLNGNRVLYGQKRFALPYFIDEEL